MSAPLLIVYFIATAVKMVAQGANETKIVALGADEIKIVAQDANETMILAKGANEIMIETQNASVIKIVDQDSDETDAEPTPKLVGHVTLKHRNPPRTYQYTTTQRSDIFQNYGYPRPKDLPILNRKIFKGARVTIREHPYVVSIRRLYSYYLPGTLITDNLVLTVAHPLYRVSTKELGIVAGENYSDRGVSINPVLFLIIHEEFQPYSLANDISILRTFEEFYYSTNVKPIRFHSRQPPLGSQVFVTGWGRCDFTGRELCLPRANIYYPREVLDPMLRTVTFTVTNNSYCNEYTKNEVPLKPGMMCMGTSRYEEFMTSCLAVPGAPQVVHGRLTGILSWGVGCGYTFDMPLVYVDLFHYQKWLYHNMDVMQRIPKQEIAVFNVATKAYIMQQWVNETIKKSLREQTTGNQHDLQIFDIDIQLARVMGTVYDIRDFIYDGKYHRQKQMLFSKLRQIYPPVMVLKPNHSIPMMPFLSKEKLQKLGFSISQDGSILSEEEDY